jgi:hypothetical protein
MKKVKNNLAEAEVGISLNLAIRQSRFSPVAKNAKFCAYLGLQILLSLKLVLEEITHKKGNYCFFFNFEAVN